MAWWRHDCAKHGHRFEARYDSPEASPEQIDAIGRNTQALLATEKEVKVRASAPASEVYVRDICVRCGETRERKP